MQDGLWLIGNNIFTGIGLFSACGLMLLGLFATYPVVKAYEKGTNFTTWYIFSFLLFLVALIKAIIIKEQSL